MVREQKTSEALFVAASADLDNAPGGAKTNSATFAPNTPAPATIETVSKQLLPRAARATRAVGAAIPPGLAVSSLKQPSVTGNTASVAVARHHHGAARTAADGAAAMAPLSADTGIFQAQPGALANSGMAEHRSCQTTPWRQRFYATRKTGSATGPIPRARAVFPPQLWPPRNHTKSISRPAPRAFSGPTLACPSPCPRFCISTMTTVSARPSQASACRQVPASPVASKAAWRSVWANTHRIILSPLIRTRCRSCTMGTS